MQDVRMKKHKKTKKHVDFLSTLGNHVLLLNFFRIKFNLLLDFYELFVGLSLTCMMQVLLTWN